MYEIVKSRVSTRSYSQEGLNEADNAIVKQVLLNKYVGVFSHSFNIRYVNREFMNKNRIKRIGTYGMITGAPSYIFSTAVKEKKEMIDYGYCLEWIILNLTKAGIETCWLGGTFNKRALKKVFSFKKEIFIPGVIAIGHHADKNNFLQNMISHAHQRKTFDKIFYNENWEQSLTEVMAGNLFNALDAIRLAPSDMNSQPWRILKKNNKLQFYLKEPQNIWVRYIDIGIAMCHFDRIREIDGIKGRWMVEDEVDTLKCEYVATFVIEQ